MESIFNLSWVVRVVVYKREGQTETKMFYFNWDRKIPFESAQIENRLIQTNF